MLIARRAVEIPIHAKRQRRPGIAAVGSIKRIQRCKYPGGCKLVDGTAPSCAASSLSRSIEAAVQALDRRGCGEGPVAAPSKGVQHLVQASRSDPEDYPGVGRPPGRRGTVKVTVRAQCQ